MAEMMDRGVRIDQAQSDKNYEYHQLTSAEVSNRQGDAYDMQTSVHCLGYAIPLTREANYSSRPFKSAHMLEGQEAGTKDYSSIGYDTTLTGPMYSVPKATDPFGPSKTAAYNGANMYDSPLVYAPEFHYDMDDSRIYDMPDSTST